MLDKGNALRYVEWSIEPEGEKIKMVKISSVKLISTNMVTGRGKISLQEWKTELEVSQGQDRVRDSMSINEN